MRKCKYCKTEFEVTVPNRIFCSSECRDKQATSNRRYGGRHFEVLERDNFTCQKCGAKEDIVVHHLDNNIEHNKLSNLITWCRPCHTSYHNSLEQNVQYKHISKEQIIKAIEVTSNLEDASKILGITRKTLMKKRLEYGLPNLPNSRKGGENPRYKTLSVNEINMAFELEGNWTKVAERLGVSPSFLRKRRRELGMEMDAKKRNKLNNQN